MSTREDDFDGMSHEEIADKLERENEKLERENARLLYLLAEYRQLIVSAAPVAWVACGESGLAKEWERLASISLQPNICREPPA